MKLEYDALSAEKAAFGRRKSRIPGCRSPAGRLAATEPWLRTSVAERSGVRSGLADSGGWRIEAGVQVRNSKLCLSERFQACQKMILVVARQRRKRDPRPNEKILEVTLGGHQPGRRDLEDSKLGRSPGA